MANLHHSGRASALPLPAFERALIANAARSGCEIAVADAHCRDWRSALFSGAKLEVRLSAMPGERLDAWLAGLLSVDLPMRGHLLADIALGAVSRVGACAGVEVSALTVEGE